MSKSHAVSPRRRSILGASWSRLSSALAVVAVFAANSAPAATNTFLGTGTNTWNLLSNWGLGATPGATDALLFDSSSLLTTTLDASWTSQTLAFDTGANNLTIDANASGAVARTLTLSGGTNALGGTDLIATSATSTGTINIGTTAGVGTLTVAIGADSSINVANAAATVNFGANSILSGAFSLTKSGAGTLTLAGANTFGGAGKSFTMSAGTLNLNNAAALGNAANAFIINGGTINNTSAAAITMTTRPITLGGDFTFTGTKDLNLGAGAVTLTAARSINVTGGNLTMSGAVSGATFGITKTGAGTLTLSGVIGTTTGGLAVNGGTLIVSNAANTFTGNITVDGATSVLQMTSGSNGNTTSGPFGIVTGGTAFKTVSLTNGGTFRPSATYNDNTPSAALPGAGVVFSIGTGGGTFDTPTGVTLTIDDGIGVGTGTTNAELQGSGTLTKTGVGTLSLGNGTSNFSTFTGAIVINGGLLTFGGTSGGVSPLGSTSAGTTIASGAGFSLNGSTNAAAEPLTVSGTGLVATNGVLYNSSATAASFAGPVTLAATSNFGVTAGGNMTLLGVISGTAGNGINIVGGGAGLYVPAGANTYAGDTHLTPTGTTVPNSDAVGSASTGNLVSGAYGTGTLFLDGGKLRASTATGTVIGNAVSVTADTSFLAGASKTLTFTGPVTLTGNRTLTQLSAGQEVAFTGAIGGSGASLSLGATNVGIISVAGANTYTGATTVNAGTLAVASTASFTNPTLTAQTGGTLLFRGNNTVGGATTPVITIVGGAVPATTGTLSLGDGTANTLTINSATPATPALLIGSGGLPANLIFDIGAAAADRIALGAGVQTVVDTGGATVTLNAIPAGGYDGSAKVLFSSPTTDLTTTGGFFLNTQSGNWGGYNLSLTTTANAVTLTGTLAGTAPATAYFKGNNGAFWNAFSGGSTNTGNFTSDAGGTTAVNALIDGTTDVHLFATGATNLATSLGQNFTIKSLTTDGVTNTAMSVAGGGGTLTITPAASTSGVTMNAGSGTLGISANVILGGSQTWTNNSASLFTVSGNITGTGNLIIDNTSTAGITVTGSINPVGSITRSASSDAALDNLTGVIGANVTAITQNNPNVTSSLVLDGANTAYAGTTTINAGRLDARNTGTTNVIQGLGTGPVILNGGTLDLRANGSGSAQVIPTGNNLTVAGSGIVDVQRFTANTGSTITLNNLSIGSNQLTVNGAAASLYSLSIAGTTNLTGAATLNANTAALNLLGKVNDNGNNLTVSGAGGTKLFNSATGGGANSLTGTLSVNGGVLVGLAPAADAVSPGSNTLGTATIALSGTNPVLRLAPSFGGGLNTAATAGLVDKSYVVGATLTSLAATNFLGATQPITTGTVALQNPTGQQIVSQLNFASQASALTASHQYTGLINITTAGSYLFQQFTDDNGNLLIDGNAPIVTSNTTVANSFYLTAGLHIFTSRWNNNAGNGGDVVSYQGPDSATLVAVPASAFSNATAAQLATNFGNNVTLAAGSSGTIDISSNTSLGTLSMTGTGAGTVLNVTGSGDVNTLTTGGLTVTDNLTITNPTANLVINGGVAVTGGPNFTLTKNGFGSLTVKGSYAPTGQINYNAGSLLSFADNGAGSNGTINKGNLLIGTAGLVVDVRANGGGSTGNTVAFGNLLLPSTATTTSTTFTAGDGYNVSFTGLALPGGTGANSTIIANTNVTISGNVTSQMTGFGTGNFDTIFLGGTATGSSIQGSIGEAGTFVPLTGGYTRIVKQDAGTWTLSGANTYTGITQVQAGTLKAGASDIIGAGNLQGVDVTATGAGVTARYDFNGFNQTLNTASGTGTALNLGGSTATSAPVIAGVGSTVTLNGNVTYTATNNPLGGTISVGTLDLGGGNRTFTVNDSTSAAIDLTVSSAIQNGTLTKAGAGVLSLTSTAHTFPTLNIQAGTVDLAGTAQTFALAPTSQGSIVNGSLAMTSLLKQGPGTLSFGVTDTAVTSVVVSQGLLSGTSNPATPSTLNLNFAAVGAPATNLFSPTATLTLGGSANGVVGGGSLTLAGAAAGTNSETFVSTLVDGGASYVAAPLGTSTAVALNLGTLTRNPAGTLDITVPTGTPSASNGVTIANPGTGGTLLTSNGTAYAIVGGNDWAANSTVSPGNIVGASVAGAANGTLYTTANSAATFSGNADITATLTATSGSTVNSIRFNTGALTLTLAGVNTVTTGGILFGSGITGGTTITGGSIRPGAGQELVLFSNKGNVTNILLSALADGASGPTTVTYRGNPAGATTGAIFDLRVNSTYTGPTYITAGRVGTQTTAVTTPLGTGANAIVYVDGTADGQFFSNLNSTIANPFVIVGTGFNEGGTRRGVIRLDSTAANTPTLSGPITLAGDATIGNNAAMAGAGSAVMSGNIGTTNAQGATSFALTKILTGVLKLSGTNSQTATNINQGALNINADEALGVTNAPLTFTGAAANVPTLQFASAITLPATRSLVLATGATGFVDTGLTAANSVSTIAGVISGSGAFTKAYATVGTNTNPLVLSGVNTFTGNVTATSGWLVATNSNSFGVGAKTVTATTNTSSDSIHLDPGVGGVIDLPANMAFTTSNDTFTLANEGTIANDSGNNIIRGNVTMNSGGGGTILASKAGSITFTGTFTPNSTARILKIRGDGAGTISGVIANGTTVDMPVLRDLGSGTWTLSGANTYTGSTTVGTGTVGSGTLKLGNVAALGGLNTGVPTDDNGTFVNPGGTLDLGGQSNVNEIIRLSGTGVGGAGALINTGAAASIGNALAGLKSAGTTGITISGATSVSLSGGGAGTGATATASLGVVAASFTITGGTQSYTTAPTVTIAGGTGATATAILSGGTTGTVTGITITGAGSGFAGAPTVTFSGGVVGTAGTAPTGTGNNTNFVLNNLVITGAGSGYNAPLTATINNTTGANAVLTASVAGVQLAANSSVGGTGDITLNSAVTESGGSFGLTKVGPNSVFLKGLNAYTGATSIQAGSLVVSGTLSGSSAVTVTDNGVAAGLGGTLAGAGTVGNVSAIATTPGSTFGGTINPGNLPGVAGTLNVGTGTGTGLNLGLGATLSVDLGGTGAGTYDRINVAAGSGITLAGNLSGSLISGYTPTDGDLLFIAINNGGGATSGAFANTFDFGGTPAVTIGSNTFLVSYGANFLGDGNVGNSFTGGDDVALQAIPEPGTAMSLLGGLGLLVAARRRRSKK